MALGVHINLQRVSIRITDREHAKAPSEYSPAAHSPRSRISSP
jgi:hypothetical protein